MLWTITLVSWTHDLRWTTHKTTVIQMLTNYTHFNHAVLEIITSVYLGAIFKTPRTIHHPPMCKGNFIYSVYHMSVCLSVYDKWVLYRNGRTHPQAVSAELLVAQYSHTKNIAKFQWCDKYVMKPCVTYLKVTMQTQLLYNREKHNMANAQRQICMLHKIINKQVCQPACMMQNRPYGLKGDMQWFFGC